VQLSRLKARGKSPLASQQFTLVLCGVHGGISKKCQSRHDVEIDCIRIKGMAKLKKYTDEEIKERKKLYNKKYYDNNHEKVLEIKRNYRDYAKDKISKYQKEYMKTHKEQVSKNSKNYRFRHRDKILNKQRVYSKQWRLDNLEKIKIRAKLYRENNLEKIRSNTRLRYYRNINKIKERQKKYYTTNRKKRTAYSMQWRKSNINKYREYQRKYSAKYKDTKKEWSSRNREKINASIKKWRSNNKDFVRYYTNLRRERKLKINEKKSSIVYKNTYYTFKNKCFNCGCSDNLAVDHHYPLSKGFALTINNAVLLCKSCNSKKAAKLPESFYSPEQLTDLQLNYGISKSPIEEKQPSLFEARMPKNLERDNGILEAMNAA